MEIPAIDWRAIGRALSVPFPAEAVEWRQQGKGRAGERVQVVAYIDARAVQQRLDEVVGPGAWSFTWEPVVVSGDELRVVKGALTIHGVAREDVGTASTFEASKGAVSDALKRCAVGFGVARYLYAIPSVWIVLDDKARIPDAEIAKLRAALRRHTAATSAA